MNHWEYRTTRSASVCTRIDWFLPQISRSLDRVLRNHCRTLPRDDQHASVAAQFILKSTSSMDIVAASARRKSMAAEKDTKAKKDSRWAIKGQYCITQCRHRTAYKYPIKWFPMRIHIRRCDETFNDFRLNTPSKLPTFYCLLLFLPGWPIRSGKGFAMGRMQIDGLWNALSEAINYWRVMQVSWNSREFCKFFGSFRKKTKVHT